MATNMTEGSGSDIYVEQVDESDYEPSDNVIHKRVKFEFQFVDDE